MEIKVTSKEKIKVTSEEDNLPLMELGTSDRLSSSVQRCELYFCPMCNEARLEYVPIGYFEDSEDGSGKRYIWDCECKKCGWKGREVYKIEFLRYEKQEA